MRRALCLLLLLVLCGCLGSSPTEPSVGPPTIEDVVEALFFGTGRAGEGNSPAAVWHAFPRGSMVRLVVASSVDRATLPHLERQLGDLNQAFGTYMSLQLTLASVPDPQPGFHEVTLTEVSAELIGDITGEPGAGGTCREVTFSGPAIVKARCLLAAGLSRPEAAIHEVGHGLGFEHIRDGAVAAMMNPSAPVSDFTGVELEAIHRVFASGLEPGATRADFARLGLIGSGVG
jgi:hypothetical protein